MSKITAVDFNKIAKIAYDEFGVEFKESKMTLIESRLSKRLSLLNLKSFKDYISVLEKDNSEKQEFINCLTTNKTEFFREKKHFDLLEEYIKKSKQDSFYIWCAACSTGQEVITLSMVLENCIEKNYMKNYKILASDIDTEVLTTSTHGVYSSQKVESEVPPELRMKYFNKTDNGMYQFDSEILSQKIKFRLFNLHTSKLPVPMQFDYIFLRNVLIYFNEEGSGLVINRLLDHLTPGGNLFLSHSESIRAEKFNLQQIESAVYEKK